MVTPAVTGAYLRRNPRRQGMIVAVVILLHVLGILIFLNFGHKVEIPNLLIRVTIVKDGSAPITKQSSGIPPTNR